MRTSLGTMTLFWRNRKWVWSNRSVFFGPVTGGLNRLVESRHLSALVDEFEAWLADTTCRATRLAHRADLWAIEAEVVAAKDDDPPSTLMTRHGGVLKSLASSAREFERATSAVAVAQARKADPNEGIAQMSVAWARPQADPHPAISAS
jgi:hypothetical protein